MTGGSPREPSPDEIREELDFYLEERMKELMESGVPREEAARRAWEAFGDPDEIAAELALQADRAVARSGREWRIRKWLGDVRLAARSLRRNAMFAVGVVLLLAVGIGATTTVFAVVDAVAIRPLPYPEPDELLELMNGAHSPADFVIWEREIESIAAWGAIMNDQVDLVGDGPPEQVSLARVTPGFLPVLGATTAAGRLFVEDDFVADPTAVVLSHGFWERRWGADPEVLGRQIQAGGQSLTVVGVMSEAFDPLVLGRGIIATGPPQMWVPADMEAMVARGHGFHALQVVGRLADGVGIEAAEAEMRAMSEALFDQGLPNHTNRDGTARHTSWEPLHDRVVGSADSTGLLLLGAVGCLLLIACANAANLFLARGARRTREMALKGAIGASRGNLVTQLGTESVLISLSAGALGVAIAAAGVRLFRVLEPGSLFRIDAVALSPRVLAFAVLVSVATGMVFGLLPALRAASVHPGAALRSDSGRTSEGRRRRVTRNGLVVAEVALSVALLVGAGVLFRSFLTLTSVETGFDTSSQLVTVNLRLPEYESEAREQFTRQLLDRLRATVPGATHAFTAPSLPIQFAGGEVMGRSSTISSGDVEPFVSLLQPVTDDYFDGLGIRLVEGRSVTELDAGEAPLPVVVDETIARTLFQGEAPLGRSFELVGYGSARVVGVASDVRFAGLERETTRTVYLPWQTFGPAIPFFTVGLRTEAPLADVAPLVREAVWAQDPGIPVPDVSTMDLRISRSVASERYMAALLSGFAVIAGLMAVGGLYGTLLYTARQRQREMGIRVAIGAERQDLIRMVLVEGTILTAIGIAVGLVTVWVGADVLESYVFGIAPRDPLTVGLVSAAIAAVAIAVSLVPALRATVVDPMSTLRTE